MIRAIAGVTLMGLGVIGTFLPVIPGIPLFLAGLALVGRRHPAIRRLAARVRWWRQRRGTRRPKA